MNSRSTPLYGQLLHLSYNMWEEHDALTTRRRKASLKLEFDEPLWRELTERMAEAGMNLVVLDLGDGIRYRSHPEIAVEGAREPEWLAAEAARLRAMGLELIPKLNFSAGHDTWLGPLYSRCLSTPLYYEVCTNLIREVCELTRPRFFHLGMDEENYDEQQDQNFIVIRKNDLFWHDLLFLCRTVEEQGARPWIWSDTIWEENAERFLRQMPRNVIQSIWYYGVKFDESARVAALKQLEAAGFDQIPTMSPCIHEGNPQLMVDYCRSQLSAGQLMGFLQTPWARTMPEFRERHLISIRTFQEALRETGGVRV